MSTKQKPSHTINDVGFSGRKKVSENYSGFLIKSAFLLNRKKSLGVGNLSVQKLVEGRCSDD